MSSFNRRFHGYDPAVQARADGSRPWLNCKHCLSSPTKRCRKHQKLQKQQQQQRSANQGRRTEAAASVDKRPSDLTRRIEGGEKQALDGRGRMIREPHEKMYRMALETVYPDSQILGREPLEKVYRMASEEGLPDSQVLGREPLEKVYRMASEEVVPESGVSGRSNLDCFLQCTLPTVQCQYMPKSYLRAPLHTRGSYEAEGVPFYTLGDLWHSFDEWSAYGAGVPIVLPSGETVVQYYVPYLSALQIYGHANVLSEKRRLGEDSDLSDVDFRESSSEASSDNEGEKTSTMYKVSLERPVMSRADEWRPGPPSEDSDVVSSEELTRLQGERGQLIFEFFERSAPYGRAPLSDKIAELATGFPRLRHLRSIELSSASWMSVAWYPIYRIPTGPTLRDLATCFLTFHSLSMPFQDGELVAAADHSREGDTVSPPSQPREAGKGYSDASEGSNRERQEGQMNPIEAEAEVEEEIKVPAPCRVDGGKKVELPSFGLASYKLRGSLWATGGNVERRRVASLAHSADSWLKRYNVRHPDFDFFASRGAVTPPFAATPSY